jgi:hypothetical protein
MASKITKSLALLAASLLVSGCFVQIEVGPGGHVESKSGKYFCEENSVCMVTIADYLFFEEFVAVPNESYFFRGWKHGISQSTDWYRLCPGQYGPCNLGAGEYSDNALAQAIIDDEAIWVLEPDFVVDTPEELFQSWLGEWQGRCYPWRSPVWMTVAPCTDIWCPAAYVFTVRERDEGIWGSLRWINVHMGYIDDDGNPSSGPASFYFDWSSEEGANIYSEVNQRIPVAGVIDNDNFEFWMDLDGTDYRRMTCGVDRNDGIPWQ